MATQLISLSIIALVSFLSSYIASLIPNRPIPETVFLVFVGAALGPYGLNVISHSGASLEFLSELGLAFLFLMAGYEIEVKDLVGNMGRHASLSWLVSLTLGVIFCSLVALPGVSPEGRLAVAVAMTTTAYGTLAPIMRERNLVGTPAGKAITVYGAVGELLPVLAIALLLTSRSKSTTVLILGLFLAVCLVAIRIPKALENTGSKVITFLRDNAQTGSQAPVRLTVLLLVSLVAFSAVFDLDAVLGAFAAGFILRATLPDGDELLETKIEGMADGFLVPTFFVISGTNINLKAVSDNPALMFMFMAGLILVRTIPVFVSLTKSKETQDLTFAQQLSTSIYCTMALPLIVAITSVAQAEGALSSSSASVLVCAGALTVLIVPLLTTVTIRISAAHPIVALEEITHEPSEFSEIIHKHNVESKRLLEEIKLYQEFAKQEGKILSSTECLLKEKEVHQQLERKLNKLKQADKRD